MVTETNLPPGPPAAMAAAYGDRTQILQRFLNHLRRLPLESWMRIAESAPMALTDRAEEPEEVRAARVRLRAVMDTMPVALRQAKRRVHDIADATAGFTPRTLNASMKRVALTAALALVARPYLFENDFAALYAPFSEAIPPEVTDHPPPLGERAVTSASFPKE